MKDTHASSGNGLGEMVGEATPQPSISIHRQYEDRSIKWKFSNTVKEGWRLSELSGRYDESEDDLVSLRKKLTLIAIELTATANNIPVEKKE